MSQDFNFIIKPDAALFLDRDGVINELLDGDYIKDWDKEWTYTEKAVETISALSKLFKYLFVVTNQQGIGKGLMTEDDLEIIHNNLQNDVSKAGGKINRIYFAPQLSSWHHEMRKPNTGMGLLAKEEFPDFNFENSFIVGDYKTDMEFGRRLNMTTIYVGKDDKEAKYDFRFSSLFDFYKTLSNLGSSNV